MPPIDDLTNDPSGTPHQRYRLRPRGIAGINICPIEVDVLRKRRALLDRVVIGLGKTTVTGGRQLESAVELYNAEA